MTIDLSGLITADMKLAQAKAAKIAQLSAACQQAIYAGYDSDALGSPHHYPALDTDQANMGASVIASLLPNLPADWTTVFMCQDNATGAWALTPHTAAQIQQAGNDGKAAITALRLQNAKLAADVAAATTVEAVQAIVWAAP